MTAADVISQLWPNLHWLAAFAATIVVPTLLWLAGFRFQWRRDRREEGESVASLMKRLADMQGAELARLAAESDALRSQLDLLSAGRFRLQEGIDSLREELIAGRVLIHDYERRLGLPETHFPALPTFSLTDRVRAV